MWRSPFLSGRCAGSRFVIAGMLACAGALACAEEKDVIKTDRPDFVESSDVVGMGHFQVEAGYAVERNRVDGGRERLSTTPLLLRAGVGDEWELRLETDGRSVLREDGPAGSATTKGYADVSLGVKWHAQDGDGMKPSIGWLLHADMDTGSRAFRGHGTRPSLRMSAEWELPRDVSLGVMPGLLYDKGDDGRRFFSGIFGVTLGKAWSERFSTFIEIAAPQIARAKHGGSMVTYDAGIMYLLSNRWQVDAAVFRAANRNTPDLTWTVGISRKF